MQRIHKMTLSLVGLGVLGLSVAFAQDMPAPQQQAAPVSREAAMARRAATQKLKADFGAAIKNGALSADDAQKAQNALAQLQPHAKGAPRDPQARHEAMKTVRQMASNPALRPEDRDVLAKDLAAMKPARK